MILYYLSHKMVPNKINSLRKLQYGTLLLADSSEKDKYLPLLL